MRGWSLSIGRYFGVDVRLHALFVLLLPATMLMSGLLYGSASRGLGLWLLMLLAVLVRETGRGIALAALGIEMNRLVLLPTGAAPVADGGAEPPVSRERLVALVGPLSNFFAGITLALLMYSATSHINLFEKPWFGPAHLLRATIWTQVLLGGLNLLPAFPLDAGVLLRRQFRRIRGDEAGTRASAGLSQAVGTLLFIAGLLLANAWVSIMGCVLLLAIRSEAQVAMATTSIGTVTVGDVMLREFGTISSSDTLEGAVRHTVQSLHDVFPVVRGPLVVGSIDRDTLVAALRIGGNGYVQGSMKRTVHTARADEPLLAALQAMQGTPGPQLLHVVEGDRLLGIVTPSTLNQSLAMLARARRASAREEQARRRG